MLFKKPENNGQKTMARELNLELPLQKNKNCGYQAAASAPQAIFSLATFLAASIFLLYQDG
jgi:hypothetical protein